MVYNESDAKDMLVELYFIKRLTRLISRIKPWHLEATTASRFQSKKIRTF